MLFKKIKNIKHCKSFPDSIRTYIVIFIFLFSGLFFSFESAAQNDTAHYWEMSLEKLSQVEMVTASKYNQKAIEVPATVKIINAAQIKERNYLTLDEALADLPGFQFRNIQSFNSYVFLRGIPNQNNHIILMVDGVVINELNSGGFYGGGQYNLNNIKQIEIVYGPASVLYGTNAVSGVINIITNDSKLNRGLTVNSGYGSFNTYTVDGNYSYYDEKKDFGFSIAGMYKSTDRMNLSGDAGDNNWTGKLENFEYDNSFEAKFNYKQFIAGVYYQNKQTSCATNNKSVGTNYRDNGSIWNIRFINSYIGHKYEVSDKLSISSKIYFRDATVLGNTIYYILKVDSVSSGDQVGYYRPNFLVGSEVLVNYSPVPHLKINGGGNVEYEEISNGFGVSHSYSELLIPSYPDQPLVLNNWLGSLFCQGGYKFFDKLEMVAGFRYDQSSVYNNVFTPRTGLVFTTKKITLKALYGEAYRAPKNWDYTFGNGNLALNPERMQSVEISAMYLVFDELNFGFSVFRNNLLNGLVKNTTLNIWENRSKAKVDGMEAEAQYSISRFRFFANYSYNKPIDEKDNQIPEIAENMANAGVSCNITSKWNWELRGNYIDKRLNTKIIPATGSNYVNDAFLLHTTLSYKNFHNFDFKFAVNNILDTKYYHTSNALVERFRQPGRSFFLQITFHPNY